MGRTSLAAAALLLLAAGCGNYTFHSNLDPGNFKEYYKASYARETTLEELGNTPYTSLGLVEGLSCQERERDYIANERDARTELRKAAADRGANALVFGKCVRLTGTPACRISVTCYGEALRVKE
ncbi:MAG: exopolysaccharide biosynthesis protein [Succinivibrionaceae bacterium]|nr:exopolysaccharide biosynthesis protein [Succinivibrionaceae bacterium]